MEKHPRLRGEDWPACPIKRELVETPPLTRGRPSVIKNVGQNIGNTPAYAGKTFVPSSFVAPFRKHPRLRGEDSNILYKDQSHNTKYAIINCPQRFPLRLVILT